MFKSNLRAANVTHNQTVSYLTRRFREIGIRPATRHGQNFLVDINLQKLLVATAELEPRDVVLEVGTGTGSLTAMMAEQAGAVVTIEIDRHLYELASEELIDFSNVTMLLHDALKNKNRFDDRVIETVQDRMSAVPDARFKLVANLPFNVATPILSNLLSCPVVPSTMTATIQKELADRIVARPSTKDYNALSIWMQSQSHTEIVRVLAPSVFWPRPKVTSAIIHVTVDMEMRSRISNPTYWHHFVRAMFLHRRKFFRSVVLAAFKKHLDKQQVDALMAQHGFGPTTRAEQLDVSTMHAFCESVRHVAPDWSL